MTSSALLPGSGIRSRRAKLTITGVAVALTTTVTMATASFSSPRGERDTARLTDVVPLPASVTASDATFELGGADSVYATAGSADAREAATFLAELLREPTGFALPVRDLAAGARTPRGIVLSLAPTGRPAESYQLDVTGNAVVIKAGDRAGLLNGVHTLRQLLPVKVERDQRMSGPWKVPGGRIADQPRYAYRGAMLDVARHFLPTQDVKKYIDAAARYKINHLHLHLVDDQGWRLEIDGWPALTEIGGSTGTGGMLGGHYTQDEYREIVAYAQERGVTVVPEIEGPAHMQAALASYAKLNCDGVARDLYTGWVPSPEGTLCLDDPDTYEFLDAVISQIAALTPGPYVHIGGDEVYDVPDDQKQAYYDKVSALVEKHGKKLLGWQETAGFLDPQKSMTQVWITGVNEAQVRETAAAGGKVIMSPSEHAYLDMKYTEALPEYPLGNSWAGTTDVKDSYDWKPEEEFPGLPSGAVAGVEGTLFTETVFGVNQLEHLAFPRLLSIAELGWAPASAHDWDSFKVRLAAQGPRLREARVNYYLSPDVPWPLGS
jgi:hexosaminidase